MTAVAIFPAPRVERAIIVQHDYDGGAGFVVAAKDRWGKVTEANGMPLHAGAATIERAINLALLFFDYTRLPIYLRLGNGAAFNRSALSILRSRYRLTVGPLPYNLRERFAAPTRVAS